MRYLLDAQLPAKLCKVFIDLGFDALHTASLPEGNRTSDRSISQFADLQERVVVTKDSDFVSAHVLTESPQRLLLVSTGNISNQNLVEVFRKNLNQIDLHFQNHQFIELASDFVVIHY